MVAWDHVTRADVLRAIEEYDRLGPELFFSEHCFGPYHDFMSWPGKDAVTRRKQSWAQLMSTLTAPVFPPSKSVEPSLGFIVKEKRRRPAR
jgi:hypothetical protein